MQNLKEKIKSFFIFSEPESKEKFILDEDNNEDRDSRKTASAGRQTDDTSESDISGNSGSNQGDGASGRARRTRRINRNDRENSKKEDKGTRKYVSSVLSENLDYIKKVYSIPLNGDMILREFDIVVKDKVIPAFMIFFDGMTDRAIINDNILKPLMLLSNLDIKGNGKDLAEFIFERLLVHNQAKMTRLYQDIIDEVNFGGCGIFVDGIDTAFSCDVKGWEHRGVERPNTETVLRGPQEGFTEVLRINTALIRKILKDEDLIVEDKKVGRRSKTPCSLLYIKDIANEKLVNEARRRLEGIKTDYIVDSGELEQYFEESSILPSPQVIATERPDRVAAMLGEGRIALVLHGSPFVLVIPATIPDLMHSAEDTYLRFPYVNFLRFIRYVGIAFSLLLPGVYIAITNYHHEMIPTDLLLAIEASREKVPFPSIVEILIMEFSFELIREAGIRVPSPIGPTLGIIGALILGQAAVAANIVSPILIIVVAVTGIGSFTIPNHSFGIMFRILRFGYILLGGLAGFLGIALGIFIQGIFLVQSTSMGVPLLIPLAPKTKDSSLNQLFRKPIWKQEKRADYLNVKDEEMQPEISRSWNSSKKQTGSKEEKRN